MDACAPVRLASPAALMRLLAVLLAVGVGAGADTGDTGYGGSAPGGGGGGGGGARGRHGNGGNAGGWAGGAAPRCEPPHPLNGSAMSHWLCQRYNKVCIDQQQFITYDPQYNPALSTKPLPYFDVKDMVYNWPNPYGNGDKFVTGRDIHFPPVVFRANTSEEAAPDLQHPAFSNCTHPLIMWHRWLYNVGEVFETSFVRLVGARRAGQLDPRLSPVLATPHGLRVPRFAHLLLNSLFRHPVVSLADLSSRAPHPRAAASNATAEGWHVRCFETVTMCRFKNRKDDGGHWEAGQYLLHHYRRRLPSVRRVLEPEPEPAGADGDALKVVFASRPNATGRAILNEPELLAACNALDPAAEGGYAGGGGGGGGGRRRYSRVKCVAHVFGRDLLYDLALASVTDVLVAVHGAAGYHSFYMPAGSSLLELLPPGFPPEWANKYYAKIHEYDKKVFYWSIWVTNPNNSRASELEGSDVFNAAVRARERHVLLPRAALAQQLRAILRVGGDPAAYRDAYVTGEHAISDELQKVPYRPSVGPYGWANYTGEEVGGEVSAGPDGA